MKRSTWILVGLVALGLALPAVGQAASYPRPGRPILFNVPWAAGGSGDITARIIAAGLSKELGATVQVENKAGAGSQVGLTEFVRTRPDGQTIALTSLPPTIAIYLDFQRKAAFSRKDFQPVALTVVDPTVVAVKTSSPFKSVKDLIDAAKAAPGKVKVATGGVMADGHLGTLMLQKAADVNFAVITFDGGVTPAVTAIMGGHADAIILPLGSFTSLIKGNEIRVLGLMDRQENKFIPGVKTVEAQGYKGVLMGSSRGIALPAGAPKEIMDTLSGAIKRVLDREDVKAKMDEMWLDRRYLDAAGFAAYWAEQEELLKPLISLAR
jgi:tripartite-type tricarboxylate transporter receptor subunit TctC